MGKSRILFVLHLPPPLHGAAMMGEYILKSKLINNTFEGKYVNLSTSATLSEIGKGQRSKILGFFKIIHNVLCSLFLEKNFTLCYVTLSSRGFGFYKDLIIVLLVKLWGIKIVYHFHNKGVKENSKKWWNRSLYRLVFKNSKVILLSKFLYTDIKDYVAENNVYYCPNGIPPIQKEWVANFPISRALDPFKFIFLSSMTREKGIFVLLDACQELHRLGLNFRCTFVGPWTGIKKEGFVKEIKLRGLTKIIDVVGPEYRVEKWNILKNHQAFVFPTMNEAFGLVNLEAMQCGLPVIASSEGGIPDLIIEGESGFLIQKRSVGQLVDRMEFFIRNPDKAKEMGLLGKSIFHQKFTLELFENRFNDILTNIIQREL